METSIQGAPLSRRDETNVWTGLWEATHSRGAEGFSVHVNRLETNFFILSSDL